MASGLDTRRQDVRLESFLRRQLSPEVYERVCASEGCVLFSPEERRVHRYVVLGHRQLFCTEFPPKNLRVLLNLGAITSISVLDDLPDFLSGEEQRNTIHIQIRFRREATPTSKDKQRFHFLGKKKFQKEAPEADPARSSSPTLPRALSPTFPGGRGSSPTGPTAVERGRAVPRRSPRLNSQDTLFAYAVTPSSPTLSSQQRSPGSIFATRSNLEISHHTPVQERGRASPTPLGYHHEDEGESPLNPRVSPLQEISYRGRQQPSGGDMRGSVEGMQLLTVAKLSHSNRATSQPDLSKSTGAGHPAPLPHWKGEDSFKYGSSDALSSLHPSSLSVCSMPVSGHGVSSRSVGSLSTLGLAGSQQDLAEAELEGGTSGDMREAVVDLYVLKAVTNFYHQLRVCWENAWIRQVSGVDGLPSPLAITPQKHEQFSQHFCTLKEELLTADHLEAKARLAQELCTACQKYFIIKKMFWEDSELLEFCSKQLQDQLSQSKSLNAMRLENCMEYCIILLELLYRMLSEAHLLPKRLVQLICNDGSPILTLASTIARGFPLGRELGALQGVEFSENACGVLYELVGVVKQAQWPQAKKTKMSISWFVQSLFKNELMKGFCASMLRYIPKAFSGADTGEGKDRQVLITLYQFSTLLHVFLKTSPTLTQFFRKHFMEEFRYYINISKGKHALPAHQPLAKKTLELLETCRLKILSRSESDSISSISSIPKFKFK